MISGYTVSHTRPKRVSYDTDSGYSISSAAGLRSLHYHYPHSRATAPLHCQRQPAIHLGRVLKLASGVPALPVRTIDYDCRYGMAVNQDRLGGQCEEEGLSDEREIDTWVLRCRSIRYNVFDRRDCDPYRNPQTLSVLLEALTRVRIAPGEQGGNK